MDYFIGDKREQIKFDYYISEGEEGTVSRYGNEAIKIYWKNIEQSSHPYLSLEDCVNMSELKSDHILLPRRIVYNSNDEFVGYSTKHINGFFGDREFTLNFDMERYKINNMSVFSLVHKMNKIYREAQYLSNMGIVLSDIDVNANYIFNGQFWLIDPGCYKFSSLPKEEILETNIDRVNELFIDKVLCPSDEETELFNFICDNDFKTVPDMLKHYSKPFVKIKKINRK